MDLINLWLTRFPVCSMSFVFDVVVAWHSSKMNGSIGIIVCSVKHFQDVGNHCGLTVSCFIKKTQYQRTYHKWNRITFGNGVLCVLKLEIVSTINYKLLMSYLIIILCVAVWKYIWKKKIEWKSFVDNIDLLFRLLEYSVSKQIFTGRHIAYNTEQWWHRI